MGERKDQIFGKPFFKVGQQVRPSFEAIHSHIIKPKHRDARGVVTYVDNWNSPTVRWAHRKTASSYAAVFIEPDRRRSLPRLAP